MDNRHTLAIAAEFLKSRKGPRGIAGLLRELDRTMSFPWERGNRLRRFAEMIHAYRDGEPIASIEHRYGCSRHTIIRYARIMGLPKRAKAFDVDRRTRVIRLYKAERPIAEIARRCGVSQAYVSRTATEERINRKADRRRHHGG